MLRTLKPGAFALALSAALLTPGPALAQELVPRAYWPAPEGTNVLSVSYQNSSGDIVTDPSLPLAGVDSNIHVAMLGYQRTLGLFGRTTNLQLSLPYSWAHTEGTYLGQPASRDVTGPADARLRLSVNLRGAPSMNTEEFRALVNNPTTLVGVSLLVQVPTGQYDPDRLINLGTHRWSVKPALGVIRPLGRGWSLEFEAGGWFFGDNDAFLGQTRQQDPILSLEAHVVKGFQREIWASLDANYYTGGQTTVGSVERGDLQRNSRCGVTVLVPLRRHHVVRGSYSTGVVTESGGDFEMVSISYLYVW